MNNSLEFHFIPLDETCCGRRCAMGGAACDARRFSETLTERGLCHRLNASAPDVSLTLLAPAADVPDVLPLGSASDAGDERLLATSPAATLVVRLATEYSEQHELLLVPGTHNELQLMPRLVLICLLDFL